MSNTLLVPIELDVLLANKALICNNLFRKWSFSYDQLNDDTFGSPMPKGFDSGNSNQKPGAYLHWELPRALRSGKVGSTSEYPLVPNRWLLVRTQKVDSGPVTQKSWVIESDCPSTNFDESSPFMVHQDVVSMWKQSSEPNRKKAFATPISTKLKTKSYTVNLGKVFDLKTWKEQAAEEMFLTAIAPGNIEFSSYMPFNNGIFSFYDDLSDVADTATISYAITGWYSDVKQDIVALGENTFTGCTNISDLLSFLEWSVADKAHPTALDRSLYSGMKNDLPWEKDATSPIMPDQLQELKDKKNMTVAIANTGVDAFTTLVAQQLNTLGNYKNTAQVIELLRAFQYDMIEKLNEVNGDALLKEMTQKFWYSSKPGGTRWSIVNDKSESSNQNAGDIVPLTTTEKAWLLQLNQDQDVLDKAMEDLYGLQWDLNSVWWKKGYMSASTQSELPAYLNKTGIHAKDLDPFLDPLNTSGTLHKVLQQLIKIDGMLKKVPQPIVSKGINEQDAYHNGIVAFAQSNGITEGKFLKPIAGPRYYQPNNPNLFISGLEPSTMTDPNAKLTVRLSSQEITSFNVTIDPVKVLKSVSSKTRVDALALGSVIPAIANASLPSLTQVLFDESFLLDSSNAAQIGSKLAIPIANVEKVMSTQDPANYKGILPSNATAKWSQDWNPMYLEWRVSYIDVPFEYQVDLNDSTITRNWDFDGTDYSLSDQYQIQKKHAKSISGRSLLSPHTQFTFGARLKTFVDQYGGDEQELKELYKAIEKIDGWKFLTQEMCNLNDYLSQRDARAFRRPTVESVSLGGTKIPLETLIGFVGHSTNKSSYQTPAYSQGLVNSFPAVQYSNDCSEYPFHGIRSGQFYLSKVWVYDKFGRVLNLIDNKENSGLTDAKNFPLVVDEAYKITDNITPTTNRINAPFDLPPRLLQASRLDMLLVDQMDGSKVLGLAPDVNPVCGWVVPNHLDQSVQVFAPDGSNVGEIMLIKNASRVKTAKWSPPIHSSILSIGAITKISPELGGFVNSLNGKSETEFHTFLQAIDSTLWTTSPLGRRTDQNLSLLIGRPLALLRVQMQFSLEGKAMQSCNWPMPVRPAVTNPNIPAYTSSNFSIRLGDLTARNDGVIGYFEKSNYDVFNSVAAPGSRQPFIKEIGPLGETNGNYINLPFDGKTKALFTILADPRASIHATTGILPVKELTIPLEFVTAALSKMEVTFRTGPLLTRKTVSSTTGGVVPAFVNSINYLPITEKHGTWSWWEKSLESGFGEDAKFTWEGFELKNPTLKATIQNDPAIITEGYLQFKTDLDPEASED